MLARQSTKSKGCGMIQGSIASRLVVPNSQCPIPNTSVSAVQIVVAGPDLSGWQTKTSPELPLTWDNLNIVSFRLTHGSGRTGMA